MFNIDHMTDGQSDHSQPINNKKICFHLISICNVLLSSNRIGLRT